MLFSVLLYGLLLGISHVLLDKPSKPFTILTEGCIIPKFPIIGENIRNLVSLPKNTVDCSSSVPLLNSNETNIWVEKEALSYKNILQVSDFYCCYVNFSAKKLEDINYAKCIQFTEMIRAQHEFVRVECYYLDDKIHDEFFVFPTNKEPLKNKDTNKFNVFMFGLESISRMNFLRTMPETAKFLHQRGSIQLLGYNKLGDNSFPNLFPLLTGRSFKNVLIDCFHRNKTIEYDICNYIWDKFKSKGYVTVLGSDSPAGLLGSYEYSFNKLPTDYYLQPLMYETRKLLKNMYYYYHMCVGNKFYFKVLLNYISKLLKTLNNHNLFGIFWEESVSHEHLNYPHLMDAEYRDLLLSLENNVYLNESILIFFSDHGMRWGEIVQTDQGRQEERLPLMEVLFPQKFKNLYKLAYENFKLNSGRLTTPYDIYYTLIDLLDPTLLNDYNLQNRCNEQTKNKHSLFLPVSDKRTCAFVGINEHWCTCHKGTILKTSHKTRQVAADHLIMYINNLLYKFPQCHELVLDEILDVSVSKDSQGSSYRVVVRTSPGNGIFDGTIRNERNVWAVSGTVSRLNLYRGQSNCLQHDFFQMYCYCK